MEGTGMQLFSTSLEAMTERYTTLLQTLCDISESYYYLGRLDDAIKLLKIGEQLLKAKEVTRHDQLKFLLQSGKILTSSIFYRNRDAEEALATLAHAKQLAAFVRNEQGEADALDLLGFAYYYKQLMTKEGESSTALAYCQQALERREVLGDQRGISESSFHVGLIYENGDQPDLDQARIYYTRAYQIARQHGYKLEQSYAVRHLGGLLAEMQGDLKQAQQYFEESLALREEIGFKITLPFSHLAVGEICAKRNELTVAARHYQRAEILAREMEQPVARILSQLSLGEIYLAQQQRPQALECIEQAYSVAKEHHLADWMSEATARREAISN
jgi:tetratricopeptide (TPR) repeat protein